MALIYKSQNKKYSFEFERQVENFGKDLKLWNKDSKVLIALSGGEDSMALLFFFHKLKEEGKIAGLRALHIHHGTRVSQDDEEKIVRLFCESLRVKLQVFYLHDLKHSSNFEKEARLRRYDIFSKARIGNEIILLGHHLDDSFEWSLMQSFKSSEVTSSLGIPVKRDFLIRPFLSVSKKQISLYRKFYELPYVKDPTNDQVQFERNYLRLNIIPEIAKKYPNYLKHYARKQNALSRKLGLHLLSKKKTPKVRVNSGNGFILYTASDETNLVERIKVALKKISDKRWRAGKQEEQIKNMLHSHKFGPMHLPGGFELYSHAKTIAVVKHGSINQKKPLPSMQKVDLEGFKQVLQSFLTSENPTFNYPYFVGAKSFDKSLRTYKKHSLFSTLDTYTSKHQLSVTDAFSLVEWWSQPNNQKKSLSLTYLW